MHQDARVRKGLLRGTALGRPTVEGESPVPEKRATFGRQLEYHGAR